ncbi:MULTISPECIES: M15 family metallopeptidase [unclassified Chelatococcus]|uniref:M15 family metallopeptidase n=1 Tax=unclassified Chelatococcus TaxID=2638111 RepID=UPI0003130D8D|nr:MULTISPECIES: M15 family metallopeptidase [unclassified Chelatococcus]
MANIDLANFLAPGQDVSHLRLQEALMRGLTGLLAEAPDIVRQNLRINSGYRSPERQAQLFDQALAKYGSEQAARKWVAPPGRSRHNFGMAVDLGYGQKGTPIYDEVRQWVHQNANRFGLHFPMAHEPWHVEPIGSRREIPGSAPVAVFAHNSQFPTSASGYAPESTPAPQENLGFFLRNAYLQKDLGSGAYLDPKKAEMALAELARLGPFG